MHLAPHVRAVQDVVFGRDVEVVVVAAKDLGAGRGLGAGAVKVPLPGPLGEEGGCEVGVGAGGWEPGERDGVEGAVLEAGGLGCVAAASGR